MKEGELLSDKIFQFLDGNIFQVSIKIKISEIRYALFSPENSKFASRGFLLGSKNEMLT